MISIVKGLFTIAHDTFYRLYSLDESEGPVAIGGNMTRLPPLTLEELQLSAWHKERGGNLNTGLEQWFVICKKSYYIHNLTIEDLFTEIKGDDALLNIKRFKREYVLETLKVLPARVENALSFKERDPKKGERKIEEVVRSLLQLLKQAEIVDEWEKEREKIQGTRL